MPPSLEEAHDQIRGLLDERTQLTDQKAQLQHQNQQLRERVAALEASLRAYATGAGPSRPQVDDPGQNYINGVMA